MKRIGIMALLVMVAAGVWAASEITIQAYLKAEKGARKIERSPGTISIDWTGNKYYGPVVYSTTPTYQALSKGSVGNLGYMWIRNVGGTSMSTSSAAATAVVISFDCGTTDHLSLKTNEYAVLRLVSALTVTNIMVKAAGASTNDVEVTILED